MKEKRIDTLFEIIKANKSFSCALNEGLYPEQNVYITFELILIYLNTNINLLREYDESIYDFIKFLIGSRNYYIEDANIYFNDKEYSIDYFVEIVRALEEFRHRKIIIPQSVFKANNNSEPVAAGGCKIYSLNDYKKISMYEMSERNLVFQYTNKVDDITIPYIRSVTNNFKNFIDEVVINYLNSTLDKIPIKELMIVSSYINLFPLFGYGKDLIDFPFELMKVPFYEMGVAKITFDNKEVIDINKKYNRIRDRIEELSYQVALGVGSEYADNQVLGRIKKRITALKKEEVTLLYELYELTHLERIFNPTLLQSIWDSFLSGTVDINNLFHNPVLRLFFIKDDITRFYCAMRLDTLTKLIDNDLILDELNNNLKLLLSN